MGRMPRNAGIQAGIQNPNQVAVLDGIPISSDLGAKWHPSIQALLTYDYSSVGGSPIVQYHSGLKQVHIEPYDSGTNHGVNLTSAGQLGAVYYNGPNPDISSVTWDIRAGVDYIYLDTNRLAQHDPRLAATLGERGIAAFGDKSSELVSGIILHEMLHESADIDLRTTLVMDQITPMFAGLRYC